MIGFVFAYMVTKLFSLMSSFREDKLRVVSYNEDVAPADGQNVPRSIPEEELEADGDDEQVGPETTAPSSSSSASEPEGDDHHKLEMIPHPYDEIHVATDGGALSEVSIPDNDDDDKEEAVKSPVVCDDTKTSDVAPEELDEKAASLGEEGAVIALVCLLLLPFWWVSLSLPLSLSLPNLLSSTWRAHLWVRKSSFSLEY